MQLGTSCSIWYWVPEYNEALIDSSFQHNMPLHTAILKLLISSGSGWSCIESYFCVQTSIHSRLALWEQEPPHFPGHRIFCAIGSSQERAELCWSCRVSGCVGPQDGPVFLWSRILISYFRKPSKPTITSMFLCYAAAVSCTFFIPEWSFCIGIIYIVHSATYANIVEVWLLCLLSLP